VPWIVYEGLKGGLAVFDGSGEAGQEVLRQALSKGPVVRFERYRPSLAEVFREVIKDEITADLEEGAK
jgi:ABC-2 type transport system ATP-binding protein